jgi:hypothetical protein
MRNGTPASRILCLETSERPECQRQPRFDRERRVAAGEDQAQPLVRDRRRLLHLILVLGLVPVDTLEPAQELRLALQVARAPDPVDRAVAGRGHEPAGRVGGNAVSGPPFEGVLDRVLKGVLGEVEVAEDADQGCEHPPVLLAEQAAERGVVTRGYPAATPARTGTTGRTSTEP